MDSYLAKTESAPNPTVLRWRVSLMFVGGLLALSRARFDDAIRFFRSVVSAPVDQYSTTLLTKPAEAAYLLGLLLASQGRRDEALRTWWNSFKQISATLGERLVQGYEVSPPTFEIREMADALSLCGRLVAAAAHGPDMVLRTGIFYDETHFDSVFQKQSLRNAETQLVNLHREFLAQKSGVEAIVHGKEWLESQWKASETERVRLQDALTALLSGKEWLESQWKASETERVRLQDALTALLSGKEWLESQWKTQLTQIESYEIKITRLKKNVFIRLAKKLGFFRFIE
jgi:hypothetical protein